MEEKVCEGTSLGVNKKRIMENWQLIAVILFILILSVILLVLWNYSSEFRRKVKEDGVDNFATFEKQLDLGTWISTSLRDGEDSNSDVEDISEGEDNIDISDVLTDPSQLGGLFERCPCYSGLICDGGMCKTKKGNSCVTTAACMDDSICYLGKCVSKPRTNEEIDNTKFNGKQICLNRHFLKLYRSKFNIESGWWTLNKGLCICESNKSGIIYAVTENNIYQISSKSFNEVKIASKNIVVKKMFRFLDKINVLSADGKLYQLTNESHLKRWKFRRINQIYGKNLSDIKVEDVYPCSDGSISLKADGSVYMYFIRRRDGKWVQEERALQISYGDNSSYYSILYPDGISIYRDRGGKIFLKGNYKDVVILQNSGSGHSKLFVIRTDDSSVYEYYYSIISTRLSKGKWRYRHLITKGDRLFKTFDDVWLLSQDTCSALGNSK